MVIREHDAYWHGHPPTELVLKAQFPVQGRTRCAEFRRLRSLAPAWRSVLTPSGPPGLGEDEIRNPRRRPGSNNTAQGFLSTHESRHCSPSHASRHWLALLERCDKVSSQWWQAGVRKRPHQCKLADRRVSKFLPPENESRESSQDHLRSLAEVHGNTVVNASQLGSTFP